MSAAALIPVSTALETARHHHHHGQLLSAAEAYRSHLAADPRSQPALLGLSLIARQSSQLQPALHMAQAALAAGQNNPVAWSNLGDILSTLHQPAPAEALFRQALTLDPNLAAAHYGLGNALALQENFPAALLSFQAAAQLGPGIPEFHFAVAFAHGKLAARARAIAAYRRAVTLRPSFASAWLNLGVELIADGRSQLAGPCYRQALVASQQSSGTCISAYLNLGHLDRSRNNFHEAQQHYEAALALAQQTLESSPNPEDRRAEIHVAFAYLHLEQKHFTEAWQSLQQAESADDPLHPNPEIPNVRGILLLAEDSANPGLVVSTDRVPPVSILRPGKETIVESAIAAFHQAEFHGHKTAASNRGNALLRLGRCDEALAAHHAAVDRDPHHPGARYNLALTQLRLGDFAHGWPNYEIRWSFREIHPHPRRFAKPRWQGEQLPAGSHLFLYVEQGLGDTIQFCRYLSLVAERLSRIQTGPPQVSQPGPPTPGPQEAICASWSGTTGLRRWGGQKSRIHITLEVQPPLTRLLSTLAASVQNTHPGIAVEILPQGNPLPHFTHHCPLMSLPAVFETTLETIPRKIPYLQADLGLTHARNAEFPSRSRIPRIGLAWAGNPRYRADHERSASLQTFLPLLRLPHIQWLSLQKGEAAGQLAVIPAHLRPEDGCSHDPDFAATAALIANLDLVITTDTAVAHLAGALGKPIWLLLPWQSDWRWMQDRPDTPWYPHARLLRQSSPNNWPGLIDCVVRELPAFLAHCPNK